jgi:hypothetical protein
VTVPTRARAPGHRMAPLFFFFSGWTQIIYGDYMRIGTYYVFFFRLYEDWQYLLRVYMEPEENILTWKYTHIFFFA